MIEIVPAIMPRDLDDVSEKVSSVVGSTDIVQIDIMDGLFVEHITWPYDEVADAQWTNIAGSLLHLPYDDAMRYEFDLMVREPEKTFMSWLSFGPARIVVHLESVKDIPRMLGLAEAARAQGTRFGLSVNNSNGMALLQPYLKQIDYVQVMGIGNIGYQNEPFDPRAVTLIEQIREEAPDLIISVDGAVSIETIYDLRRLGVQWFVAGSAIFGRGKPYHNVNDLRSYIEHL